MSENCSETWSMNIWLVGWLMKVDWLIFMKVGWLTHLLFFLLPFSLLQPLKGLACLTKNITLRNIDWCWKLQIKLKITKKSNVTSRTRPVCSSSSALQLSRATYKQISLLNCFLFWCKANLKISDWETAQRDRKVLLPQTHLSGEIDSSMQPSRHLAAAETTGLWRRITLDHPSGPPIKIA